MDKATFDTLYQQSIDTPEQFWAQQAQRLTWQKPYEHVFHGEWTQGDINWFDGGYLNVCVNCVDRHLEDNADKTALIWEGDQPDQNVSYTFKQLSEAINRMANVLKQHGVGKGDRVCIYMPMIPQATMAMLACARIGAVHSVVFGGFSEKALCDRINDAECCCVITADVAYRGGKPNYFKNKVDTALQEAPCVDNVLVYRHTGESVNWQDDRDVDLQSAMNSASSECPPEQVAAEDPLFILYTSGSTGKPKGVLHTTAGYLLHVSLSHAVTFNIQEDDIYWCAADVGWITGHSYIVYGPLCNGTTTLMYEGVPTYPHLQRFWEIVDKHQVSVLYTAPTAIRALMAYGDRSLEGTSRQSLRVLGSVGEPINPAAWQWYAQKAGNGQCPVMDTWWQTETGGFMIAPPFEQDLQKPGSAMRPFLGIKPVLLDENAQELQGEAEGYLAIKQPWPGMLRTIYNNHERFLNAYLRPFPGYYASGDTAKRDSDGDLWILGRSDDVLNVAGHRLGTAEIENVLVKHDGIVEAAVVGQPDEVKGETVCAFVILKEGHTADDQLHHSVNQMLRDAIGPIAKVNSLYAVNSLPKTRSGKIMRRILRKIISGETDSLGDTSTLANPESVDELINQFA